MKPQNKGLSRRKLIGAAAATAATVGNIRAESDKKLFKVKNGRIRQSVMGWCFNPCLQWNWPNTVRKLDSLPWKVLMQNTIPLFVNSA